MISPEDILSDFLRVHLIDPKARAEASESQTFNPTASQTEIDLAAPTSGSVSCVVSVTIDGSSSKKWKDYYWDYQNRKLTFFTAFTGSEEVIINYKYGTTNWIFSDKPDKNLSDDGFPRISIFTVSGSGKRLGQYESPVESSPAFQIDCWTKNGQSFTIGGRKFSNEYLGRYLALEVTAAFEDNEGDLFPCLYNYTPIGTPRQAPYSFEFQAHHTIVEANFKGLRLGRIEI